MTVALDARDLFQQAYENRYTWDGQFPGYTAQVSWQSGEQALTAQVQINRDLTVTIDGWAADHPQYKELLGLMRDVVTHRQRRDFIAAHGQNEFTAGEPLPDGAVPIQVKGDAMGSHYQVRGPVITQVSRVMGGSAFTIDTLSVEQTAQGYFPLHYQVQFANATTGEPQQVVDIRERYALVGGYYLLQERQQTVTKDGVTTEAVVAFVELKLLA
ncbi:hypothetical protein GlitD10_1804 [Gloeomargarita lithophora Alchichica-D10]|uniref:DUF3386 domain-containing protein n=1 Tax=Gloeomargarita lithophora Alchichica-D10 TaxID=1188229 RepID=A0A1J0ADW7_9CYAN|nr:DUF3386 domain-containing protein [Gloeomargarita lithophora]APB34130.1 hypothetical protein GlitD10_1804 [Gloeomargarita lithophora Alchichica-D10]